MKTRIIAVTLAAGMIFSLAGCNKDKNKKHRDDDVDETSEEFIQDDEDREVIPLTSDSISGVWVDEHGFALNINADEGFLVDSEGHVFTICEITDEGVVLDVASSKSESIHMGFYDMAASIPLPSMYTLDITLYEDGSMAYGEEGYRVECVRMDSDLGQQYIEDVFDGFVETRFSYSVVIEDDVFIFGEDGSVTMPYVDADVSWSSDGCFITLTAAGEEEEAVVAIRQLNDHSWRIFDGSNQTTVYYMSTASLTLNESGYDYIDNLDGDYFYWDIENSTLDRWSISAEDDTVTTENCDGDIETYSLTIDDDTHFAKVVETDTYIFDITGMMFVITDPTEAEYFDGYLLFKEDVYAQALLYRERVVNGDESLEMEDISYTYEANDAIADLLVIPGSSEWIYDDVTFESIDGDSPFYPSFSGFEYNTFGQAVTVNLSDDFDGQVFLTYTIPSDLVSDPESLHICNSLDMSRYDYVPTFVEGEVTLDGDNYVISIEVSESGTYFLMEYVMDISSMVMTPATILEIDPEDSLWARTCDTGDILPMVDLDYIADSIYDEDGSANFWVSTPEELASATYYINELDIAYGTWDTMFYIHLMNDIDLTGYEWVSLGYYGNQGEVYNSPFIYDAETTVQPIGVDRNIYGGYSVQHYFQGIFYGNGYTIRGLDITDGRGSSFFERAHLATVIGLTLEDPMTDYQWIFADDSSCCMEFYDCHIAYTEPQEMALFGHYANQSLVYRDCTFVVNGEDMPLSENVYNSEHDNCMDNWVRMFYQADDGSYSYDSQSEYQAWQRNHEAFENMSYYLGQTYDWNYGYFDVSGWYIDNAFVTDFGFWGF